MHKQTWKETLFLTKKDWYVWPLALIICAFYIFGETFFERDLTTRDLMPRFLMLTLICFSLIILARAKSKISDEFCNQCNYYVDPKENVCKVCGANLKLDKRRPGRDG